jgi:hypothetical protein
VAAGLPARHFEEHLSSQDITVLPLMSTIAFSSWKSDNRAIDADVEICRWQPFLGEAAGFDAGWNPWLLLMT